MRCWRILAPQTNLKLATLGENQICHITEQELSLKRNKEMHGLQGAIFLDSFFLSSQTEDIHSVKLYCNKPDYKKNAGKLNHLKCSSFHFCQETVICKQNFLTSPTAPCKTNNSHDYCYFEGLLKSVSYFSKKTSLISNTNRNALL